MAAKTRVCSYDRAGYGTSAPGPEPRDSKAIVADLAALLKAAHEKGPYVLVGHSLGSFDMRLFALTYPKDVAGLVLVDPSADWQAKRMGEAVPKFATLSEAAYGRHAALRGEPSPCPLERDKVRGHLPAWHAGGGEGHAALRGESPPAGARQGLRRPLPARHAGGGEALPD